jgi:hypothetical protein
MSSLAVCGQSGGQETQYGQGFSEKTTATGEVVVLALRLGTTAAPTLSLLEDLSKSLNASDGLSLVTDIADPLRSTI